LLGIGHGTPRVAIPGVRASPTDVPDIGRRPIGAAEGAASTDSVDRPRGAIFALPLTSGARRARFEVADWEVIRLVTKQNGPEVTQCHGHLVKLKNALSDFRRASRPVRAVSAVEEVTFGSELAYCDGTTLKEWVEGGRSRSRKRSIMPSRSRRA